MRKIYYLGYYDTPDNIQEQRDVALSATNKMTYIVETLEQLGYSTELVSCAHTVGKKKCSEKVVPIGQHSQLRLFKTLPWGNRLKRILSRVYTGIQFRRYILNNIREGDIVIAYHSVSYSSFLAEAKKKNKFKLILEAEEIYADVSGKEKERKKEYKVFQSADAYIFPTELLHEKINVSNKPYVVIHGTYQVEENRKCRNDVQPKIHCVYAGTLDPRKGGAAAAVTAKYLPENYHIHILGFGSEKAVADMRALVANVASNSKATVTYDGVLSGEEYIRFIQTCDIGLSTQNPDADFNATSFPSKILSYMANGLRVVSIRIPAIEMSAIGDYMYYYDEQTPEKIAAAIMAVDVNNDFDSRKIIEQLDKQFTAELASLLRDNKGEHCNGEKIE